MNLFFVTNETWQGIIDKAWPYSKFPFTLIGQFQTGVTDINFAYIEENDWKFLEGKEDFDACLDEYKSTKCISIFDPRLTRNK